jgi:hypothetical protein
MLKYRRGRRSRTLSHHLTISNELYERLDAEARHRGLDDVEGLLAEIAAGAGGRRDALRQIDDLRERLRTKYGELPDSVELLRDDRAR